MCYMSLARGFEGILCYKSLACGFMKAYRFIRHGFRKRIVYRSVPVRPARLSKESSCENVQGLPAWFLKNDLMRKHTGSSSLTSKKRFGLRVYKDRLLDSQK